jgi:glycosyltransferase involved in cell wall biosynthesis
VEEVITDGYNGLLVDFFDHETLANTLEQAITQPRQFLPLRQQARQTILDYYDQHSLVEKHRQWLARFARTAKQPSLQ